jgi:2-polyprenyl-3-methyl-5-hydroxy-6-metoxy-1,4-benzoquinol methylase
MIARWGILHDMSSPETPEGPGAAQRTAAWWNKQQGDSKAEQGNFLNHPLIHAYMSLRSYGLLVGQLEVVVAELQTRTRPGDRILSVGCGACPKEISLAQQLPDRHFVGIDIANETVQRVGKQLTAGGLHNLKLQVGDFNDLHLDEGEFRAVLGLGAIHHVENLESFWAACAHGLTTDGCVIAQEYVGPNRLQWTDAQIEAGNEALRDLIPQRYHLNHSEVQRVPIEVITRLDPSEAVRSSDILPTLKAAGFNMAGIVGGGGALLQPVLANQIKAFDPKNWTDNFVLAELFRREDELMQAGVLVDHFVGFVATPPSS